jgi:uncharacterized protein YcbK (DUF882 family)
MMADLILPSVSRRTFLKGSALSLGLTFGVPTLLRAKAAQEKKLYLYNMHTGEWFKKTFKEGGAYNPDALKELSYFMRDRRTDETHPMEQSLYDLLECLHRPFGTYRPLELVCGYRSPHTNKSLRKKNKGVAEKSLHMSGRAVDVRLQGVPLKKLRDAAKILRAGGVGYYPKSNFIHIDLRRNPTFW